MVRGWLTDWVEGRLGRQPDAAHGRAAGGAAQPDAAGRAGGRGGLFFAAFDRTGLFARTDAGRFFALPPFVADPDRRRLDRGSLLAPKHRPSGWCRSTTTRRGGLPAGALPRRGVVPLLSVPDWRSGGPSRPRPSRRCSSRCCCFGALGLWRVALRLDEARSPHGCASTTPATGRHVRRALRALARLLRLIAVAAPMLGALGYMPAAGFLVFRDHPDARTARRAAMSSSTC